MPGLILRGAFVLQRLAQRWERGMSGGSKPSESDRGRSARNPKPFPVPQNCHQHIDCFRGSDSSQGQHGTGAHIVVIGQNFHQRWHSLRVTANAECRSSRAAHGVGPNKFFAFPLWRCPHDSYQFFQRIRQLNAALIRCSRSVDRSHGLRLNDSRRCSAECCTATTSDRSLRCSSLRSSSDFHNGRSSTSR